MNHIYRLVWSQRHSKFVVAHEKTRTSGCSSTKVSSSVASVLLSSLLVSPFAWAAPPTANKLPTGAQVTAGAAAITSSGNTMNVQQSTQRAAINWTNFSIGSNATVNFQQPNASAVVLNRVVGNEQSVINGALNANGQVFLLNSSGVLFGQGAQVNVGGLVASTLNMTDADFMAGRNTFQSTGSQASVINLGQITAADGGYVALLGNQVSNQGVISARLGTAALAAGDRISLNFNGNSLVGVTIDQGTLNALVENKQAIYADGGRVYLTTQAVDAVLNGVVNNTGLIQANSVGTGQNGEVILFAHGGTVDVGGTIKADGGFVETSGKQFAIQPNATVQAANWLIDPVNITIDSTLAGTIQTALGSGDVTVSTAGNNTPSTSSGQSGTDGDITVNSAITWSANNTLTLHADRNIHINADITASGASGKVALEYGQGAIAANNTSTYDFGLTSSGFAGKINLQAGQNFSTKLGSTGSVTTYAVVNTAADLQGISSNLSGNFALGGGLSLNGVTWIPIGGNSSSSTLVGAQTFTGKFEGLGNTISDLNIALSTYAVGLFGYTSGATLQNVGLVNANISGNGPVGVLTGAAINGSAINNTFSQGLVSGASEVGGLVGRLGTATGAFSTITNSYSTAAVTATNISAGGLSGVLWNSRIASSYATGSVTSATNAGGLVGYLTGTAPNISNSFASGNVTATSASAGGFIGRGTSGTILNSYSIGSVSASSNGGGFIGTSHSGVSINNSYWNITTSGGQTSSFGNSTWQTAQVIPSLTTSQMQSLATYFSGNTPTWDIAGNTALSNGNYPQLRWATSGGTSGASVWIMYALPVSYSVAGGNNTYGQAFTLPTPTYTGGSPTGTSTVKVYDTSNTDVTAQAVAGTLSAGTYTIKTLLVDSIYAITPNGNTDGTLIITAAPSGGNSSNSSSGSQAHEIERQITSAIRSPSLVASPRENFRNSERRSESTSFGNVLTTPSTLTGLFGNDAQLAILSSPDASEPTETVNLSEASKMLNPSSANAPTKKIGANVGLDRVTDVRVPVSRNSLAEIVNGGVKLPTGVEQQLFVVKAN